MAAYVSTGSPKMTRKSTPSIRAPQSRNDESKLSGGSIKNVDTKVTSQPISNQDPDKMTRQDSSESSDGINTILSRLRANDPRQGLPADLKNSSATQPAQLDQILSNLNDQHKALKRQEKDLKDGVNHDSSTGTSDMPGNDGACLTDAYGLDRAQTIARQNDSMDLLRMQKELEAARSIISLQEKELTESRNLKHTMEQAIGPASESDFPLHHGLPQDSYGQAQSAFNAAAQPFTSRNDASWAVSDGPKSDGSSGFYASRPVRGRATFSHQSHAPSIGSTALGLPSPTYTTFSDHRLPSMGLAGAYSGQTSPMDLSFTSQRPFSGSSNTSFGIDERMYNGISALSHFPAIRQAGGQSRSNSTLNDALSAGGPLSLGVQALNSTAPYCFQTRPYGAPITPLSPDFPQGADQTMLHGSNASSQTYVTPLEPMNYRRLLDKTVSCDWKYIVDKIVCNNDQQASIFLQQKLKVGTAEQKFEIVESIVNQAYPLMINRFGNFLVQRCFEHGTPEQVISIANAIHGNVISLSMDPFGCHVIQKSFDSVPEDHKADMVHELLRRIPETVIHRYACHVWQKLFELRWSGEPPQIMLKVNEALRGMWHEVALGETGSLVVQNIFENCVEEEKRPAIEEVISNIDLIAHGQFGNWCIQHLCEHGSPPDKRRVIDHILLNSYNYSIDQFASKVVEKCLKIGGPEFLDRYLAVITTARPDRPRIPLIDIAGDQYGNYLIQWILMNTHQHQREQVAIHIRKHMVSLRGSKFGSRVAMLCSNPAAATRPGPPSTVVSQYSAPGQQPRNNWSRFR